MLNIVKHLYRSSNYNQLQSSGKGASLLFNIVLLLLLIFSIRGVQAQHFDFSAKDAVKIPAPVTAQLCQYLEKRDGAPMTIGGKYLYVPVYNVLSHSQKRFADGVYMFISSVHDSGQLFLSHKGQIIILRRNSVLEITTDYANFLKRHNLSEAKQIAYLSAIAGFMQYQDKTLQEMVKSGALEELK